jgi:hypothetical protein
MTNDEAVVFSALERVLKIVAARRKPSGESEQAQNTGTGGLAPSRYQGSIHF